LGAVGAHPVALAVDPEDDAAVEQPVEHGGGASNPPGAMKFRSGMQFLLATGGDPPRSTLS
jgi:hypothetical protein